MDNVPIWKKNQNCCDLMAYHNNNVFFWQNHMAVNNEENNIKNVIITVYNL